MSSTSRDKCTSYVSRQLIAGSRHATEPPVKPSFTMRSAGSAAWQQAASSPSLVQQLSELTSQQVHNIHASQHYGGDISHTSSESDLIWQQADDAASHKRAQLRRQNPTPDRPSTSASLLSPDTLNSSSYTYSQLCHDLPLLTTDGVDALSGGILAHLSAGTLPASPFRLTLPFLYQLTVQTNRPPSSAVNEALVASLSQLTAIVLFSLFPLLLTSSHSSLSAFLSSLPPSLPSVVVAEQGREEAERAAVPAFVVENNDVEDEREEKVREWSEREGEEQGAEDEEEFLADADEDEEEGADDVSHDGSTSHEETSAVSSWAELEDKLCSLIHLWHPRSLTAPVQPASPTASSQLVWEKLQLPSVLQHIHSLATQHQHIFQPSSTASTLLHHRLSTVLLSLMLSSPTLIPSYTSTVLSLLSTCSLSLDAFETARPFDSEREEDERICLLLLSHLCGNEKVRATMDGRLYVWRLLDRNLPWLASYLQYICTSLSAACTANSSLLSSSLPLSLLSSLIAVLDFYLCCHAGLKAGRVDVGEPLVSAGIIDQLLSLLFLSFSSSPPSSPTVASTSFPLPSLYTFLTTGSGVSPLIALQCERSTVLLQQLSSDSSIWKWQAEKLLLPVLLAWHLLRSQRSDTDDTHKSKQQVANSKAANGQPPASKASKKKTKLLVSTIVEDDVQADEATELLPAVDAVTAPVSAAAEALFALVTGSTAAVRQYTEALTSASDTCNFTPLVDTLSSLAHLISLHPSLSSIVRPSSPLPSSERLDRQLVEWATAVGEVRRLAGETIRRNGSSSTNVSVAEVGDEDDEQRRQRVRNEQRVRHAKQQHTAELQRLLNCCKTLFVSQATDSKKD